MELGRAINWPFFKCLKNGKYFAIDNERLIYIPTKGIPENNITQLQGFNDIEFTIEKKAGNVRKKSGEYKLF